MSLLNCSAAPPVVPAGGSIDFTMELPIFPDEPAGTTVLGWLVTGADAASGHTSITIVNDSQPQPVRCTPAEHVLPCVAGMHDGVKYRVTVDSHCGLRDMLADVRPWRPAGGSVDDGTGNDNPPKGWGNPFDVGSGSLFGGKLQYVSSNGQLVTLLPETAKDPVLSTCE